MGDTIPLLSQGRSGDSSDNFERAIGLSSYVPNIFDKISGYGANIPEAGLHDAFYLAQPSRLIFGFLVVMVLSFICTLIAIFTDMSNNIVFICLSLLLPIGIMSVAWIAQWAGNVTKDNTYRTLIANNYTIAKNTTTINRA